MSTQSAVVDELRGELDRRGFGDVVVAASDETSYTGAAAGWKMSCTRGVLGHAFWKILILGF